MVWLGNDLIFDTKNIFSQTNFQNDKSTQNMISSQNCEITKIQKGLKLTEHGPIVPGNPL